MPDAAPKVIIAVLAKKVYAVTPPTSKLPYTKMLLDICNVPVKVLENVTSLYDPLVVANLKMSTALVPEFMLTLMA